MKKYIAVCVALVVVFFGASSVMASTTGQHLNRNMGSNFDSFGAVILSLKDTPEPSSLFVLGAVLFSLAFVVFWKSAKGSKEF